MARLYTYIVLAAAISFFTTSVEAASGLSGSLDTSITTDFFGHDDQAQAVAIQPDGKIVVAGYATDSGGTTAFAVARYMPDGVTLDATFGTNGKAPNPFPTVNAAAEAVVIQADGNIVVGGYVDTTSQGKDVAVARYTPSGVLDTIGFNAKGTNPGTITTDFGSKQDDQAQAIALQQIDNKDYIVVAGFTTTLSNKRDFAIARYTPGGVLDTTAFNSKGTNPGTITTDFGSGNDDVANGLAVQPDGKIVVTGYSILQPVAGSSSPVNYFALARYDINGGLDTSFNANGMVLRSLGSQVDATYGVTLQPDGKILVAGQTQNRTNNLDEFVVARYNLDGSPDTNFGSNGLTKTSITENSSQDKALSIALQPDGKIVAAGFSVLSQTKTIALVRYNPDGSLDLTFNPNGTNGARAGTRVYDFGTGINEAHALALRPDGRIFVAGFTETATGDDFAVLQYYATDSGDTWGITPSSTIGFTNTFLPPPGSNGTTSTSDPLVITGLGTATCTGGASTGGAGDCIHVPVTVSKGQYENNPGAYTTTMGWAANGDTFYVKQDIAAGAKYGDTTKTTLSVGGLVASNNYALILCPTQAGSGCPMQYTFTTTIDNAPTISGTPATTAQVGTAYTFRPDAGDPDAGDTLTFSILNKPLWATFDKTTGTLSGTPTNVDIGSNADIRISVTDSLGDTTSLAAFGIQVSGTSQSGTGNGGSSSSGSGRTGPAALSLLAIAALRKRIRPSPRPRWDPRRSMPPPCREPHPGKSG